MEVTLPPPHGPTSLNISMIHPGCSTDIVAASKTHDPDAALRDWRQYRARVRHMHRGHTFVRHDCKRLEVQASRDNRKGRRKQTQRTAMMTSVSPSCGTFVPCVLSPLGALLLSPWEMFLANDSWEPGVALAHSQGDVYCACSPRLRGSRCPGADTSWPGEAYTSRPWGGHALL
jgi:hypothetical protein